MNGQNQSAEMFLFIFIDLEMTVMQKMAVEPGISSLDKMDSHHCRSTSYIVNHSSLLSNT